MTAPASGEDSLSAPITIVLVDNDPECAAETATRLERDDRRFNVVTVSSVGEGMEHLTDDIDCVVSEYEVGEADGIEFLEAVRAEHGTIPFILFTGSGSEGIAAEAIDAGVDAYQRKRTDSEQYALLANRIRTNVAEYRERARADRLEQKYAIVAETATDMFWKVDVATGDQTLSDGVRQFGYDPAEIDPDLEWWYGQLHPDDEARIRTNDEAVLARDEAAFDELTDDRGKFSNEYRWQRADGTYAHCRERGVAIFEDGDPTKLVGTVTDVSEQKAYERELEQLRDFFDEAERLGNLGAWELDTDGDIVWTDGTRRIHGVDASFTPTLEQAIGFYHPDDRDRIRRTLDRLQAGETFDVNLRLIAANGEQRWIRSRGKAIDETTTRGFVQDVTEQKTRQRELKLQRDRFEALFEAIPEPVVNVEFTDDGTFVRDVNASFESTFGYDAADLIGRDINDIIVPDDEDSRREAEAIDERAAAGEQLTREVRRETHDGCRDFLFRSAPIVHDGEINQQFGLYIDISERKRRSEELERQNERLEKFASVVSHDLKNPLQVAQGRLELAREECESPHLENVAAAFDRMETLIDDLLTLARVGETAAEVEPIDLETVVTACHDLVEMTDATLVAETDQQIYADRTRLKQLLENLVRNAITHGGAGVTITVGELDDLAGFYVADDGRGISEQRRSKVFESGYSTTAHGTGFGLAIVHEIVQEHDWEITVTDSEEGGAMFEIRDVTFVRD